jgi:hypothetical protein
MRRAPDPHIRAIKKRQGGLHANTEAMDHARCLQLGSVQSRRWSSDEPEHMAPKIWALTRRPKRTINQPSYITETIERCLSDLLLMLRLL